MEDKKLSESEKKFLEEEGFFVEEYGWVDSTTGARCLTADQAITVIKSRRLLDRRKLLSDIYSRSFAAMAGSPSSNQQFSTDEVYEILDRCSRIAVSKAAAFFDEQLYPLPKSE